MIIINRLDHNYFITVYDYTKMIVVQFNWVAINLTYKLNDRTYIFISRYISAIETKNEN